MSSKAEEEVEEGGEVVFAGSLSHSMTGRTSKGSTFDGVEEKLVLSFSRVNTLMGVSMSKVFCGPLACHFLAVASDGKAWTWGRNESGQLGVGDLNNRYNPTPLNVEGIVDAACTGEHTLVCTKGGEVFGFGSNACGQLGNGSRSPHPHVNPIKTDFLGTAHKVSAGKGFSCVIDSDGSVFSFGSPERGHLGNGTEGKSLERAGKYTYSYVCKPTQIIDLAAQTIRQISSGRDHTVCADEQGRVWAWGFNGYGQLGIGNNKMQLSPVPVPFFHNKKQEKPANIPSFMWRAKPLMRAKFITCGSMCCNVVDVHQGALYFWGIRKVNNEADLRPKLVQNVQGWKISTVACGPSSTIVAADYGGDSSLITWGLSPTHGELGYGEGVPKSSSVSKKVESLDTATVLGVAMGLGNSLAIVKRNKKGLELLAKTDVLSPEEPPPQAPAKKAPSKKKKKKKRTKSTEAVDGGGAKTTKKKKTE